MPRDVVLKIRDPWMQSVFFYFGAPWEWVAFHGLFLLCCAAFMVGWRTSWVKWIVLVGQISYDYRNPTLTYGVDWILASLLFILCVAPVGRALSLDRVRAVRAAKAENLEARLPPYSSAWAGACTRLMQIQMAVLFFYSAISKLAMGRLVERRRRMDRLHHPTSTTTGSSWACWHRTTGWSTSRPMARF